MAAPRRPEVERAAVLFLHHRQGYGIRAIARILKRPISTVSDWIKAGPDAIKNPRLKLIAQQAFARSRYRGAEEHVDKLMGLLTADADGKCPCCDKPIEDCDCGPDCRECDCADAVKDPEGHTLPGWEAHDRLGAAIGPTGEPEAPRVDLAEDEQLGATPAGDPSLGDGGTEADAHGIKVAGLAVLALDSKRLLMLRRADDPSDKAAGCWEFPGGHVEPKETPAGGATREWSEEVGWPFDWQDANSLGGWRSSNGVYAGFVVSIPRESMVRVNANARGRSQGNPDDPGGQSDEAIRWWDQDALPMDAMRPELAQDWQKVVEILQACHQAEPQLVAMGSSTRDPWAKRRHTNPAWGDHKHLPMGRPRGQGATANQNPFPEGDTENLHPRMSPTPSTRDEPTDALEQARQRPQQEPGEGRPTERGDPKPLTSSSASPEKTPGRDAINARAIDAMKRYFNLLANDVPHEYALKASRFIDPDFEITPEQAVRAWDALGMLDEPRKFSEKPTGAALMRSHLQLVGNEILRFGWSAGNIVPPGYVRSVYEQFEWAPAKVHQLEEVLFSVAGQNYLEAINQQLMSLGEPVIGAITDPAVLQQLSEEAETAAAGISETFNKELGGQVYQQWIDLRSERGTQMSRWWLEDAIDGWAARRAPWKARQVAMTEGGKWFNSGVKAFVEHNTQLDPRRFDVSPDECECQTCVDMVENGPYDLETALALPIPAHPNCHHFLLPVYSMAEAPGPLWTAQAQPDALAAKEGHGGNAQTLRDYWSDKGTKHGKKAGIDYDTPPSSDFGRCVTRVSKFMTPEQAKGYCALRHHDATGEWPGHAPGERWASKNAEGDELEMWEYNPDQPRGNSNNGGQFSGPTPQGQRKGKGPTIETKTPGMTPGQKAHVSAHNTAATTASADAKAKAAARDAGGLHGRAGGAGESNFGKASTGKVGDVGEGLFWERIAPDLAKRYGTITRTPNTVSNGARNTPLDFMGSNGVGLEVKTINAKSKNLKTAIKAEEKARKEQALVDLGLKKGVTILQIADTEAGTMRVYTADGFVSKSVAGFDQIGSYSFPTGAFSMAEFMESMASGGLTNVRAEAYN